MHVLCQKKSLISEITEITKKTLIKAQIIYSNFELLHMVVSPWSSPWFSLVQSPGMIETLQQQVGAFLNKLYINLNVLKVWLPGQLLDTFIVSHNNIMSLFIQVLLYQLYERESHILLLCFSNVNYSVSHQTCVNYAGIVLGIISCTKIEWNNKTFYLALYYKVTFLT